MLYDHITYHKVGSKNLFILPTLPSWIVLNDEVRNSFESICVLLQNRSKLINKE